MYAGVLQFWFDEIQPEQWWRHDPGFDAQVHARFATLHASAACCELYEWRAEPEGRLAEIIVLDQFSRNMYRDSALAFANDPLALSLAQEAVRCGADATLTATQRNFLYMPYMHSESPVIHRVARALFDRNGSQSTIDFEKQHGAIVDRFGRYPHRNRILGRESTPDEIVFLQQPGSGF